ncbi:hypothetical protein HK097_009763 [Rhizophlyctis rosea]|uniref:CRAL-TRIO domain-containing protein n=1 Tax=Rhizophlyctis rosea TaxID=64517 RepID=A0AAD5X3K2_9FUNG|nr:hypothetical protein HK097_009763 [Rhizophlyctis rosea]
MTSNDPGHINNLSAEQKNLLREFWSQLYTALSTDSSQALKSPFPTLASTPSKPGSSLLSSPNARALADEMWFTTAYDHPDSLMLRFLRARKWDVKAAVAMALGCIKWRNEFDVAKLLSEGEEILDRAELESAKSYYGGKDKEGRPCCVVHVKYHDKNTVNEEKTKLLTVYMMETGRLMLNPPQEMATIVFDMTDFGMANMDYNFVKFFVNTLQNFYPESLGLCLIVNAPWAFNACWLVIKPWLDPVVAAKIQFVKPKDLPTYIPSTTLPKRLNGTAEDYTYVPPPADEGTKLAAVRNEQGKKEEAVRKAIEAYRKLTPFIR